MKTIDFRRLRLAIEVDGILKKYDNLAMRISGEKRANAIENSCFVEIFNVKRDIRNYLLTETSPFNQNRSRKKIIIEAGRKSTGTSLCFIGDICAASPSTPPDIGLKIQARTGAYDKGNLLADFGKDYQNLSEIANKIAATIGVRCEFEATDKKIANYSFNGGALKQINQLEDAGNVNAFLDDDILVVKNIDKPRQKYSIFLSKDTGMIGVPELTEHGIIVRCLYNQETVIGGKLTVKSTLNPAVNGDYEIYHLHYDLSNFTTPWYYTIKAKRLS